MRVIPTVIEKVDGKETHYDIYSKMMQLRTIFFTGQVNEDSAEMLKAQLLYLNSVDNTSPITIIIDSPGGSVLPGLAIIDTMNSIKSPVHTIASGTCASMASVLVSSGEKGCRSAFKHSRVMLHTVRTGYQGAIQDVRVDYQLSETLNAELFKILAKNAGKTPEQLQVDCDRDLWLTAEEALEYGLIDFIRDTI